LKRVDDIAGAVLNAFEPGLKSFCYDNSIKRWGRGEIAWYIASEFTIPETGQTGISCTYGRWDTGEKHSVYSILNGSLKLEKKHYAPLLDKQRAVIDEDRLKRQKESQNLFNGTLPKLQKTGNSPYLKAKGLSAFNPHGCYYHDDQLILPMSDIDGVAWGAQIIKAEGFKRFLPGQRVTGCHHVIRGDEVTIFCEGYATGASISLATGHTVVVCFNASNLTDVVKGWKERLVKQGGTGTLLVAGDDDWHPTDRLGRPKANTGRLAANDAAKLTGLPAVFPLFSDESSRGTDFNDLHQVDGLEAVASQFTAALASSGLILPEFEATEDQKVNDIAEKFVRSGNYATEPKNKRLYLEKQGLWQLVEDDYILQAAMHLDSFGDTTQRRRNEVMAFVKTRTLKPIQWRNFGENCYIAFKNGIVDAAHGTMIGPVKPEYWLRSTLPVEYDENADAKTWYHCLDTWFDGDPDKAEKILGLQMFFGYCLMPHARFKKAMVCYGPPHTGKSVVNQVLSMLVGPSNVCSIPVDKMDDQTALAAIEDKWVNLIEELPKGALIADAGFKRLVSTGGSIQINPKYVKQYMIDPIAKHAIFTNHMPKINDSSNATYERLLVIEFTRAIAREDRDPHLMAKLAKELPGIAAWAVLGASMLESAQGVFPTWGGMEALLDDHRKNSNAVNMFVAEMCEPVADEDVWCDVFRSKFKEWAEKNGENITKYSDRTITSIMASHGHGVAVKKDYLGKSKKAYKGITIL
jgi:P4 family phage/plasmid primase-like protien